MRNCRVAGFAAIAVGLLMPGCTVRATTGASTNGGAENAPVRNIILLIADGTGVGVWSAAEFASDALAVKRMPVVGLVDTRSASAKVTDSAAGASVYATGERTTNRTISVSAGCPLPSSRQTEATTWPDACRPLESWFAIAAAKGKARGVVTTTSVVDATPASFVAHSPSRYWSRAIAEQLAEAELDVLMGGGRRHFEGGAGRADLVAPLCASADCVDNAAELAGYRASDRPVVGLFAPADMDDLDARPVALRDMVSAALAKLERDPDGFVALFETEATDNATHANLPLERVTADILEFDRAVGVALDFAERTPGTLVVVTADHETGGFSLPEEGTDFEVRYTTTGHSGALVPLFAYGPQAERFGGFRENYEIGRLFLEIARGWD
jgi:alkaline phosphatase